MFLFETESEISQSWKGKYMTGEQRLGAGRELGSLESNISDDEIKSIIQTDLYSCYYCCIIQGIILIQNAERIKKISTILPHA